MIARSLCQSPFFGSLTLIPILYLFGNILLSQTHWNIPHKISGVFWSSVFSIFEQMPSFPEAFPLFCALMACLTPLTVMGPGLPQGLHLLLVQFQCLLGQVNSEYSGNALSIVQSCRGSLYPFSFSSFLDRHYPS